MKTQKDHSCVLTKTSLADSFWHCKLVSIGPAYMMDKQINTYVSFLRKGILSTSKDSEL